MKETKRYDLNCAKMRESPTGEWIRYKDTFNSTMDKYGLSGVALIRLMAENMDRPKVKPEAKHMHSMLLRYGVHLNQCGFWKGDKEGPGLCTCGLREAQELSP